MPPRPVIENAHNDLIARWQGETPPSLEVFTEAVARACKAGGYTAPAYVAGRILQGAWP